MRHYRIYDPDTDRPIICVVHPCDDEFTLCGGRINETPSGEAEETDEEITCPECLKTIIAIKNEKDPKCQH